ncbi:MAG: Protein of unknown function DUF3500 [Verrucomicrobia bacterium]|jgi:hypothetical protein|nr:MAG: Protein of unknown function DUF3500 [Verrucomicrobiota bacterium]
MRKFLTPILVALAFGGLTPVFAHEVADAMALAAQDFLNSLEPDQQKKASFAFEDEERFNWHYIPLERRGLSIREMRPEQRVLAYGLLSTGLSHTGFLKATQIMSLERILWELENHAPKRDPEYYLVWIFGKPDGKGTWGWRFEGHHLSLNFTIVNGQLIAETPAFFAANPGEVKSGARKGLRVLAGEEDLARALVKSLDDGQKAQAVIGPAAPEDILTKDLPKVDPLKAEGIRYQDLNDAQKQQLWKLIDEYLNKHHPLLAAEERKRVEAEAPEIRFAWSGGFEFGQGHYYRVQGKTFVLEYCNVQNGAMHPHVSWRNFGEDFGRDLLREHVAKEHPGS